MVETILFNLASKILGTIGSGSIGEVGKAWGVEQELNALKDTLSTINAVLLDAERLYGHGGFPNYSIAMGVWFDRLQAAIYDADNLVDEFHYEVLRRRVTRTFLVSNFFSSSCTIDFRFKFKMSSRIANIRKRLDMIADNRTKFHPIATTSQHNAASSSISSEVNESEFVGRFDDRVKLLHLIMGPRVNNDENMFVLPIVGIAEKTEEQHGNLSNTCRMPEIIHDLAVYMANEECLIATNYRFGPISDKVKHVSFHDFDCSGEEVTKALFERKNLRTVFFPFQGLGASDTGFVNRCISKFKYLYVLDLSNSCFQVLPHSIGNLKHLRFFDISGNANIETLPNAICKLFNLQTLRIWGIKPSDAGSKIKKAYRKAALRHHPDKRSQYDLQEELRDAQKESNRSRGSRGPSDYYSSPFDSSANRRYWKQSWRTYGNSRSQF
ncbi:putative disease resistance protein RGA1 [Camellia lanceoleosa]|uniref:Disease resistance protein RGA1 n=1 Tax=Camellia lanceoleosa TaxID=1840588 RepID=A0ACC0G9A0_9ERIC|nr:putative disease resistance protein RGA1 [Camellia lanceoleosa]